MLHPFVAVLVLCAAGPAQPAPGGKRLTTIFRRVAEPREGAFTVLV